MLRLVDRTATTGAWEFVHPEGFSVRIADDGPIGYPSQLAGMEAAYAEMSRYHDSRMVVETETDFGTVTMLRDSCGIDATNGQLWDWARRPGDAWPCSELEDADTISAGFDTNGLVELDHPGIDDVASDEFNAWSSDVLGECLPEQHPCHFVTVGQFRG